MDLDFDTYKEAFDKQDQPFTLERIASTPEELPDVVKEALAFVDQSAVCAFRFIVYVEEFDHELQSWLPVQQDEVLDMLSPDEFATQLSPVLKSAYARMITAERDKEASHGNGSPNSG